MYLMRLINEFDLDFGKGNIHFEFHKITDEVDQRNGLRF